MNGVKIGTCSWNYDSWVGLVYSKPSPTAAGHLPEYSRKYGTAEIDSWFYKIPDMREVQEYLGNVGKDFRFTVKVSEDISLTHLRKHGADELKPNPDFLSAGLFGKYLERIRPMIPQVDAVMLEFEYLNRDKMKSLDSFLKALEVFTDSVPKGIPLAVETRNKNYLKGEYFQFLKEKGVIHVFSEKLYMPHVYEVYEEFGDSIRGTSVVRLLGGDRKEMEEKTKGEWNRIVEEKPDKDKIVGMANEMMRRGGKVIINVNNHYEGSAPLTIQSLEKMLREVK
jgi:uncharacterized protein YecE (DUF72 family)